MEVYRGAVVAQVCVGNRRVVRNDVQSAREIVAERDLDWRAFLADKDTAEVPVVLAGEKPGRVEATQRRWPQAGTRRADLVLELVDVDGVVGDAGYWRRGEIGRCHADRTDTA
jgi:hypothetical protein